MLKRHTIITTLLLSFTWALTIQAQDSATPDKPEPTTFASQATYYYNGNSRINIQIALDELHIENPGPGSTFRSFGTVSAQDAKSATVRAATPAQNLAALKSSARPLNSGTQHALAVAYHQGQSDRANATPHIITNRIHLQPAAGINLQSLLSANNLRLVRELDPDASIIEAETRSTELLNALDIANTIYESGDVIFAQPVIAQNRALRLFPNDALFTEQWHLYNTNTSAPYQQGNDINAVRAWDRVTGQGVNILIVDTGVLDTHPDLTNNARTDIDYDYFDGDDSAWSNTFHGTGVSGIAAADGNNTIGVTGVAYDANIVGVRLVAGATTDTQVSDSLTHQVASVIPADYAHVSNNSWGPSDANSTTKELLTPVVESALQTGVHNGRGGLGTVYVWAGGNGRENNQDISFDGFAASRFTIAVGATGGDGLVTTYSEPGASLLVNAPSSFQSVGTTTTTQNDLYTSSFSGTSSSAPTASGVVALMLEANPSLRWRDVQHILVMSSTKTDVNDEGWKLNGGGFLYHHDYGYGRVNANAATKMASTWTNYPYIPFLFTRTDFAINQAIPDADPAGVTRSLFIDTGGNERAVEHVEVTLNLTHTYRGDLNIALTSPSGMRSEFMETHHDPADDYSNYLLTSVAHWGEDPQGDWTLEVFDGNPGNEGILVDWSISVYATIPLSALNPAATVPTLTVPLFQSSRN